MATLKCDRCGRPPMGEFTSGNACPTCNGGIFVNIKEEQDPNGKDQHESGAKMDSGKVKAGVLEDFSLALWEVARVGSNGSIKYTRHGWESVPNGIERYKDAKWRHLLKGVRQPLDPEWNILHLAHEAWNILAKLELILREGESNATI